MILSGDVVANRETLVMVKMIRQNKKLCRRIASQVSEGWCITRVAARLQHEICQELREPMSQMDEFFSAALTTALRRTVDWQAVVQCVLVEPENN
jgi:hypothetical protein